jgi:3-oxoacyl-[acyl-carrier protein] reductase
MKRLENKVALVTGGSRGMGAAIVKQLAAAGVKVAFTYAKSADQAQKVVTDTEQETGVPVLAIQADSASHAAVTAAVRQVVTAFGKIDILINNAGVYAYKLMEEHTEADYDQMMDVNVKAVFSASLAAIPHMGEGGRIITIGSNMADRVTGPGGTLYAMSKSALTGFTKGLAREVGGKGITVNLVQPGPVDTDMNPADSAHAPHLTAQMAIPHYGHVTDIANLVTYLAGPESRFITGTALTIDGGYNA